MQTFSTLGMFCANFSELGIFRQLESWNLVKRHIVLIQICLPNFSLLTKTVQYHHMTIQLFQPYILKLKTPIFILFEIKTLLHQNELSIHKLSWVPEFIQTIHSIIIQTQHKSRGLISDLDRPTERKNRHWKSLPLRLRNFWERKNN